MNKTNIEHPTSNIQLRKSKAGRHDLLNVRRSTFDVRCSMFPRLLMNDLKFAFRQLLKNPGFTALAVLTLALGIGAAAAVCSLIQGVLLTPPLYRKPEQLILITPESLDRRHHGRGLYGKQWLEWQKEAKSFEAVAG